MNITIKKYKNYEDIINMQARSSNKHEWMQQMILAQPL